MAALPALKRNEVRQTAFALLDDPVSINWSYLVAVDAGGNRPVEAQGGGPLLDIALTPSGHLALVEAAGADNAEATAAAIPGAVADSLRDAFKRGRSEFLLCLATLRHTAALLELLQGRISDHVMAVVTDRDRGLFPRPTEISLGCSCPDWADMCKQVAAVLYGVGARLDEKPELLFVLRGVDHAELVAEDSAKAVVKKARKNGQRTLDESELSEVFGIDVASAPAATATAAVTTDGVTHAAPAVNGRRRKVRPSTRETQVTASTAAARPVKTRKAGRKAMQGE